MKAVYCAASVAYVLLKPVTLKIVNYIANMIMIGKSEPPPQRFNENLQNFDLFVLNFDAFFHFSSFLHFLSTYVRVFFLSRFNHFFFTDGRER